jgi:predicted metal-binding protein
MKNADTAEQLRDLTELAVAMGSDAATLIETVNIRIDPQLAALCLETKCPNYGQSPTCPPNVEGPEWLLEYSRSTPHCIFLKIEMDENAMYSEQRDEIAKLLHFIVVEIEKEAIRKGFTQSKGFAGGSCKNIFCAEHYICEVLEGNGACRNPDSARPSVSGFGINTKHLQEIAGWAGKSAQETAGKVQSSRYGLVLIG